MVASFTFYPNSRLWIEEITMHPTAVHRIESVVKNFKNRFVYIFLSIHRYVKLIFYKNNATLPIVIPNLHDSAPHFGACLPEIWGQDSANFV